MSYADLYRNIDFRQQPERYSIGRGEQGVLIAEPYKSEILPYWKFATPAAARLSAKKIYSLFQSYKHQGDFVGMDMTRKFLQMGWTRARRYANHPSGYKYDVTHTIKARDTKSETSDKAESARIFKNYYDQVRLDQAYLQAKQAHQQNTLAQGKD